MHRSANVAQETLSGSGREPAAADPAPTPGPTTTTTGPTTTTTGPTTTPAGPTTTPAGPTTTPAGPTTTRRRFLRYLVGFSAVSSIALIFTPVVAFLVPPKINSTGAGGKTLVGTTADIPIGHGKVVPLGSKPTIVVNTEQGVKAYSAICTHLGCIVAFDDGSGNIACPCHDGRFNPATGAVISGPPPAPLPPVTVNVEEDQIFLVQSS